MNDESEKEHGDEPKSEKEAEDDGAETGKQSNTEDDGSAEARRKSKEEDAVAEAGKQSQTEDDGSAKARSKSKEEDDVAEAGTQSKTDDDGSANARRKSKEEDDVAEAGKQSQTEDDGSGNVRRKSKEEDDVAEAGTQGKTDDDGSAKARRKSKEEDDVAKTGKQSQTEDDGSAKARRKSKEEDDVAEAGKQSQTEDDDSAKTRSKSKEEDNVAEARRNSKVDGETQQKATLTLDKNGACTCPKPPPPKPKLYLTEPSAPVRSVLITAAAIGLDLEKQEVDLIKGEHLTPNFLKLNPQHTVPTLVDGDYVLWDSHAINPYLIGKYAENGTLYPKDLQKRAIVDNRLHYNNSTIFNAYKHILTSVLFKGSPVTADHIKNLEEIYGLLNTFLEKTKFIAGDDLTIADFSVIPHITTVEILVPIDEDKFPKLIEWKRRVNELPCCAANEPGLRKFKEIIKDKLNN